MAVVESWEEADLTRRLDRISRERSFAVFMVESLVEPTFLFFHSGYFVATDFGRLLARK